MALDGWISVVSNLILKATFSEKETFPVDYSPSAARRTALRSHKRDCQRQHKVIARILSLVNQTPIPQFWMYCIASARSGHSGHYSVAPWNAVSREKYAMINHYRALFTRRVHSTR